MTTEDINVHTSEHVIPSDRVVTIHGEDLERRKFAAYRVAFNRNAADPNLRNASALVRAWNEFADAVGVERV